MVTCPDCVEGLTPPEGMVEAAAQGIHEAMRHHDWPRHTLPRWEKDTEEWRRYVTVKARAALVAAARSEAPDA